MHKDTLVIGAYTDGDITSSGPEEVANVMPLLACDLSATITGQINVADRGEALCNLGAVEVGQRKFYIVN